MSSKESGIFESSKVPYHSIEDSKMSSQKASTDVLEPKNKLAKVVEHIRSLKIEVVAALLMFSSTMTSITSTSLILDKVCLVHLQYPRNICSNLDDDNYTDFKTSVVKMATNYQLGHSLLEAAPAAVFVTFIGPWSDRYGRRFPIILAVSGMILEAVGSAVCGYFLETRAEYYFIPPIFTGLFGGVVSVTAVVYSYGSDVTPIESRTMKYAFIALYSGLSTAFGSAAGGWIYDFWGYTAVFVVSAIGLSLLVLWVVLVLPETRGMNSEDSWCLKVKNLYSCDALKESFAATIKVRPHQGRKQILLLIISASVLAIADNSTGDINYLYVRRRYGWGNATFSTITAIYSVIGVLIYLVVIPLLRYFRAGDPVLGLIATVSDLLKNIGIGVAYKSGIYHLARLVGLLNGFSMMATRSRISKVVSVDDLGKIFSFVASVEALFPIFASVLMSQIFRETLEVFAGTPYIVIAFILLIPFGVFIWMTRLPRMSIEDVRECVNSSGDLNSSMDNVAK